MNQTILKRANRKLGERGFPQTSDPGFANAVAYMIDTHEEFRSWLISCEPEERGHMYNALAPNLRFKARTLEEYLTEARADAEARQLPVQAEDGTLKEYQVPEIQTGRELETNGSWSADNAPADTKDL